jgi:hypothetical protein
MTTAMLHDRFIRDRYTASVARFRLTLRSKYSLNIASERCCSSVGKPKRNADENADADELLQL